MVHQATPTPSKASDSGTHTPSSSPKQARDGTKVFVDYIGTFDSGEVFDKSNGEPLSFVVGSGEVISGFDTAIRGMYAGEEKDIVLEPQEAYGDENPALIQQIPKANLPPHQYQAGMQLVMQTPQGQQVPVQIKAVDEETVTLNLNHPMAGKRLHFHLRLLQIE
jgi:FKBP-type peptidyl-prolyl cis-trans isomerase 2